MRHQSYHHTAGPNILVRNELRRVLLNQVQDSNRSIYLFRRRIFMPLLGGHA